MTSVKHTGQAAAPDDIRVFSIRVFILYITTVSLNRVKFKCMHHLLNFSQTESQFFLKFYIREADSGGFSEVFASDSCVCSS